MGAAPLKAVAHRGQAAGRPAPRTPAPKPASVCNRPLGQQDAFVVDDLSSRLSKIIKMPLPERLECVSRPFLGNPYVLDPLGEGKGADIDTDPLYSFGPTDCMTFVEETIALANSSSLVEFRNKLRAIRYFGGVISYETRKHFVEADWIPENSALGLVRDITREVGGGLVERVAISINRPDWILSKPDKDMSQDKKAEVVFRLMGKNLGVSEFVAMDYIPMSAFFVHVPENSGATEVGTYPNWQLIHKLPEVSILIMVRREADARAIGVIVSHMGFVFVPRNADGTPGEPLLRHSTARAIPPATTGGVIDEPLWDYLLSQEPYSGGVAFLEVLPHK